MPASFSSSSISVTSEAIGSSSKDKTDFMTLDQFISESKSFSFFSPHLSRSLTHLKD
jgi:hypothetical protein